MNKRLLLEPGGFPVYTRDLIALQDNMLATVTHLAKMVAGSGSLVGCMLWGNLTHDGNTWTVTNGAIYLSNDIFPVQAGSLTVQEGEIAYLAVQMSETDVRVYKDGNEHPAEASYKAVLTTSFADAVAFIPCTQVADYQTKLRDIVDQVGHKFEKIEVQGTDDSVIESDGLYVFEQRRGDDVDIRIKGTIAIRSSNAGTFATFVRQGLRGTVTGRLEGVSDQTKQLVTVVISESYPTYNKSSLSLFRADGTEITSLIGGAFGYFLYINDYITLT